MKTAAVIRLINEKGEILFLLRAIKPFGWCLPGGKLDAGEDAVTASIRETTEESGIVLDPEQVKVIGRTTAFDGTPVTVLEAVLDHTPTVTINKREHLNKKWMKTHSFEYQRNYTDEIRGLIFAGKTLDFIDLERPIFIPESLAER